MMLRDVACSAMGAGIAYMGDGSGHGPMLLAVSIVAFFIAVHKWNAIDTELLEYIKALQKIIVDNGLDTGSEGQEKSG